MNTSNKYIAYMLDNKILYKLSIFLLFVIIAMILFGIDPAQAANTDDGSPWASPLQKLAASLTGPVASAIALISMVICGGLLVFGGELGDFARRMVMVVLAVSVMTTGAKILSFLGVASAVIL